MNRTVLEAIGSELWAMRQDRFRSWVAAQLDETAPEAKPPRLPRTDGSVAILPIHGVIGHRRSSGYGANTYSEDVAAYLGQLAASPSVGAIVLDIDSPGGTVSGLSEVADAVNVAKQAKPVYAIANPEAASAAYHIASQATKLFSTPSGEVGSIGVWAAHFDYSEALANAGIKINLIHAGKHKVEGNPFEPLGDDARAEIQRGVDLAYDNFLGAVAKGRNSTKATVRDTFGGGRMIEADRAKDLGMIDGIATLGEVIQSVGKPKAASRLRALDIDIALTERRFRR